MATKLRVIALPDAACVSAVSILHACLYFDEVYLHAFEPGAVPRARAKVGETLQLELAPARLDQWLKPLRTAGIVRQAPLSRVISNDVVRAFPSFSSRELPLGLREAVATSLSAGADLLTTTLLCLLEKRSGPIRLPYAPLFQNPDNLDNSQFELAICTHIASTLVMLDTGQTNSLTPFTGHKAHAHLLAAITKAFPTVAKALGLKDPDLLAARHAALAQTILEESLPVVRVRAPEDILELRETLKDELLRFRTELGKLAASLTTRPWEQPFQAEVQTLLAKEVRPAIADLRRKLAKPGRRLAKHLVSDWTTIASGSALPMAAIVMQSAQLPWAVLGGLSAGLGLAALKAKVEEWSVKGDSAFTFVIEAEQRLR